MRPLSLFGLSVSFFMAGSIVPLGAQDRVQSQVDAGQLLFDDNLILLAQDRQRMAPSKPGAIIQTPQPPAVGTVQTRTLNRLPASIQAAPRSPVAVLKEECTWTNAGVANCIVWDCDDADVCVELGQYCVDHYGNTIPCP